MLRETAGTSKAPTRCKGLRAWGKKRGKSKGKRLTASENTGEKEAPQPRVTSKPTA